MQKISLKILLFFLTILIIHYSPSVLEKIQPDSKGYMNFNETRQTSYFLISQILNWLNIDIIIFQKIFLSFSIVFLVIFIREKTNTFFSLASYILIVSNIYYTSFSKTILTESIFFSLFNLAIVFFFRKEKKINLIIFALICGSLASLKPIEFNFIVSNINVIIRIKS